MTPEQVAIVQRTAAMVARDGDRFARAFYDHLFERRPSARCLFPEEMDLQRSRLVEEILLLVAAAADLPSFLQRARELGRRHQGYGVQPTTTPSSVTRSSRPSPWWPPPSGTRRSRRRGGGPTS